MRIALVAAYAAVLASGAASSVPQARAVRGVPSHPGIPQTADAPDRAQPPVDLSRKSDEPPRSGPPRTTHYAATFRNLHTAELLPLTDVETRVGADVPEARVDRFLRCRATGRITAMAHAPFELALRMAERFGRKRIDVVSGYRSDKFNELLRKKGHEVAENSRHVRGEALDFRIPEVGARRLARAVASVHRGGIGTYPHSGFVHVDVGPDRRWWGR